MLKPLVRSLVSAVVAACFALSAAGWVGPRECASHPATPAHGHQQQHEHHQQQSPAGQACAVHLCCAHLAPEAPASLAAERLTEARAHAGLDPAAAIVARRPAHALPFAHAPPSSIA